MIEPSHAVGSNDKGVGAGHADTAPGVWASDQEDSFTISDGRALHSEGLDFKMIMSCSFMCFSQ